MHQSTLGTTVEGYPTVPCVTFDELPQGINVAIYGCGTRGIDICQQLSERRPDISVLQFIDSTRSGTLNQRPLVSVKDFIACSDNVDLVLLGSYQWLELAVTLASHGFTRFCLPDDLRYAGTSLHAIVSRDRRLLGPIVPKCAYRSIITALTKGAEKGGFDLSVEEIKLSDPEFNDFYKFSFVRNPFDRLLSLYSEKFNQPAQDSSDFKTHFHPWTIILGKQTLTFEEYLYGITNLSDVYSDRHCCQQTDILSADKQSPPALDYLGHFETLSEDFNALCQELEIETSLPHIGASKRRKGYKDAYDENSRRFVQRRFARDLELFGYEF